MQDNIFCIYEANLKDSEWLDKFENNAQLEAVVSVVKIEDAHPQRMYRLQNEYLNSFQNEGEILRRQDLEPLYIRNGAFYAVKVDVVKEKQSLMPKNKKAYVMDANWSVNIDKPLDLDILRVIMKKWNKRDEDINN